jgi:hypothetical protein
MKQHPFSRPAFEKTEVFEILLRMTGFAVTVGLLIVLPALMILGLA